MLRAAHASAHAEAHAIAAGLYNEPLLRRTASVVAELRERHGAALTTCKWRCDNGFVEITLTVEGGATRGIDTQAAMVCDELVRAALNGGVVGWRRRCGHNVEMRYRCTRRDADCAQGAAVQRRRRRAVAAAVWALVPLLAAREALVALTALYARPSVASAVLSLLWTSCLGMWFATNRRSET